MLDYAASRYQYSHPNHTAYHTATGLAEALIEAQQGRLLYERPSAETLWPDAFWKLMERRSLVVLDELATRERVSDHAYDSVKRLIDTRFGLPLVVLSNVSIARIGEVYDDRIASRLAAGTVVCIKGRDRRLRG